MILKLKVKIFKQKNKKPKKRINLYADNPEFMEWYSRYIPATLSNIKDTIYSNNLKHTKQIKEYRDYMSKKSDVIYFLKQNEGKEARVQKDISDNNMALFEGERIAIDSSDEDFINLLVYKLNGDMKVTDLIQILNI